MTRAYGVLTDSDLSEFQRQITEDERFTPEVNQLFSFVDVTEVKLTTRGTKILADRSPFGKTSKRAFVVRPGAMSMFGMMRMFQTLTEDHPDELRVQFDHYEDAKSWLGLEDE